MTWDTFKRAVDSLEGYEGEIGIMGGEPTLHPEFERFAEYLNSKYEQTKKENYFIRPTAHFMRDRKLEERERTYTYKEKNGLNQRVKGPSLWSSLASNYYKYYETIQDIFRYQCVNDHMMACYHQPILVNRRDMGVPDDEWEVLRDNCWIQNVWSATITPKGCFFCEVAGALDMLFGGNGGWPIEKWWWKRKPEEFGEQLQWCELCGIALNTRSRNANEGIDDVSETMMKKLEGINSPKWRRGQVHLYTKMDLPEDGNANHRFEYHDNNLNRLNANNRTIYPKHFPIIFISTMEDTIEDIRHSIAYNVSGTEKMIVFVRDEMTVPIQNYIKELKCETEIIVKPHEKTYGQDLNRAHDITGELSSNIIVTSGVRLDCRFEEKLRQYAINPGTYHYLNSEEKRESSLVQFENTGRNERFVLYNPYAKALRKAGYDGIAKCCNLEELSVLWEDAKKVIFDDELLKGQTLVNAIEFETNQRYAIYGTGTYGKKAFQSIIEIGAEVIFYCDTSETNWGKSLNGISIYAPAHLKEARQTYDKVVIAALAYKDIRRTILENGLTDDDIVAPIF